MVIWAPPLSWLFGHHPLLGYLGTTLFLVIWHHPLHGYLVTTPQPLNARKPTQHQRPALAPQLAQKQSPHCLLPTQFNPIELFCIFEKIEKFYGEKMQAQIKIHQNVPAQIKQDQKANQRRCCPCTDQAA